MHFGQAVTDFILRGGRMAGVITPAAEAGDGPATAEWLADAVILATGHSARDMRERFQ